MCCISVCVSKIRQRMEGEIEITFGKHKGKTLKELCKEDMYYVMWLAGVTTKFSLKPEVQEAYRRIEQTNKEIIEAARIYIKDKCYQCGATRDKSHICLKMKPSSFYHYHPYGKRT